MKKIFEITLSVDIPANKEKAYIGDEKTCEGIKEVLLDETPEEVNPKIEVRVIS